MVKIYQIFTIKVHEKFHENCLLVPLKVLDLFHIIINVYELCVSDICVVFRGLPSKSPEEEEKHRQQYQEMIEAAKRKGMSLSIRR